MASLSKRLGVPLITLYLIAGAIFGAACAGLGIAAPPAVQSVTAALHNACLALITVAAGCELDPEALRSNARTIRATVVALCVSAPLVVAAGHHHSAATKPGVDSGASPGGVEGRGGMHRG